MTKFNRKQKTKGEITVNISHRSPNDPLHEWGDIIELICLISKDGFISIAEIKDRIQDYPEEYQINSEDVGLSFDEDEKPYGLDIAEKEDKLELFVGECFEHLKIREQIFNKWGSYPFVIENDVIRRREDRKPIHYFYLFLLLASTGYALHQTDHEAIAISFERISQEVTKNFLKGSAEVHIFGTSDNSRYKGNLLAKFQQLSQDLGLKLKTDLNRYINKFNKGDYGLDIVAWIPIDDSLYTLTIFGQCACTPEWVNKQFSISKDRWQNVFDFIATPAKIIFIPFFFRKSETEWENPMDIHDCITIDRLRAIYFLHQNFELGDLSFFSNTKGYSVVENLVNFREGFV